MVRLWIVLIFIWAVPALSQDRLPPRQLLSKLSIKLTGALPTPTETQAFQRALEENPAAFTKIYKAKVREYLQSEVSLDPLKTFFSYWLSLPRDRETVATATWLVQNQMPIWRLFRKDFIHLDARTGRLYQSAGAQFRGPVDQGGIIPLAKKEQRFRSMLSHLDFLMQYPDTDTNKNRKRSSYIFDTFFCKALAPTEPGDELDPDFLDPEHGTDPNCVGCHYRLDPLARFFDRWQVPQDGAVIPPYNQAQEAIGRIIILHEDGTRSQHNGTGLQDLSKILAEQTAVHQCLVKKAWQFYVGEFIPLQEEDRDQFMQAFTAQQNFQDLITEIVQHDYFVTAAEPPAVNFKQVTADFAVCYGCHVGASDPVPQFDAKAYPFRADKEANKKLLQAIWGTLSGNENYVPMPQEPVPPLSSAALTRIKTWIEQGAHTSEQERTLTEEEAKEVLANE